MDLDPWNWDAGDVTTFFRDYAANTLPEKQRSRLPPKDDFFELVESEGVTGDTLLTAIDNPTLREDYGVKSATTRSAILICISRLRARSTAYAVQHNLPTLQADTPRSLPPTNILSTPVPVALGPPEVVASPENELADDRVGEKTRSGEYEVQDAQGRKRRKLNLSGADSEPRTAGRIGLPLSAGYLPDSALSTDQVFYGATSYGEETSNAVPDGIVVLEADRDDGLEDNDFQLQNHGKPHGEIEFVHRNLRRMLMGTEVREIQRQGRDALAVFPYPEPSSGTRSATVIQFTGPDEQQPRAFKENVKYLDSAAPEKHAEVGGEWEFLMEKYAANDKVLPVFGDSETASTEDKTPTENEDSHSMAEESIAPDELSKERASELIDEMLQKYQSAWEAGIEKLERNKAYKTWKRMKRSRTLRHELIASARLRIQRLRERLQELKSELLGSQWHSEASLEQSCASLQTTVEQIEHHHWEIDVWGRKQEPWHEKKEKDTTSARNERGQQSTARGPATDRLVIPEHDRFSVSPPPEPEGDHQANVIVDDANQYEADDEHFHTPEASPEPDQPSFHDDAVGGAEDIDDSPFVVADENIDDQGEGELNEEFDDEAQLEMQSSDNRDSLHAHATVSDVESADLPSPASQSFTGPKREPLPSTPSSKRIMSIDLNADSPSSAAATPTGSKHGKLPVKTSATDDPDWATARDIDAWSFAELRRMGDRYRILLKILRDAGSDKRNSLSMCHNEHSRAGFAKKLREVLLNLRHGDPRTIDDDMGDTLRLAAGIYLRWYFPSLLTGASFSDIPWEGALAELQLIAFSGMLGSLLKFKDAARFVSPKKGSSTIPGSSTATALLLSSDNEEAALSQRSSRKKRDKAVLVPSDDEAPVPSHRKKRKRAVEQSQAAVDTRQKAIERMRRAEAAESQSAANSSQLAAMIDAHPEATRVQLNLNKDAEEPAIYVTRKIASKMKQHQIEGARFLWREITASDDDEGNGCVLAHTMGLGKTMQTIALLVAVNEAAHSQIKDVRKQLPRHLRSKEIWKTKERCLRVMVLCPAGLIKNWKHEIEAWAGKKLGTIFAIESTMKMLDRLAHLDKWMRVGGALVLGYDLFRSMLTPSTDKRVKKMPLTDAETAEVQRQLLNGPEIVVADEAHNVKNQQSGIGLAVQEIKTGSKIALTGTPMSNDVSEIYAVVSWVSPDYLGDRTDFRANFAEPIKDGLYADSSYYEKRRSMMKLNVLHREIQPKVHRANIEALRGSIPPKVEFVIFVQLQELQVELYRRYIRAVKAFIDTDKNEDGTQKTSQVVFMSMLSVLSLLTGHPYCFKEKLIEPPSDNSKKKKQKRKSANDERGDSAEAESDAGGTMTPGTASGNATPAHPDFTTAEELLDNDADKAIDTHVSAQGLTKESVLKILGGDGSDIGSEPFLSSKIKIFLALLKSCLTIKDRAIIFSQRLDMLNYLGRLLVSHQIPFGRIDGSNAAQRMELVKDFESGEFSVMLVSTKAGGVGLNMQCANRVFIFDSGFNPMYEEQAIGRAYRLGQTKPVYVYRFVADGTFERNIYNKQLFKTGLAQRVVDKKSTRRQAERSTREYIYEPKEVDQQDITEHISKDPEVLGELLETHGSGELDTLIRDVKTMETLTQEIMDEPLNVEEQKLVEAETEERKQRPRGKRATAMGMMPPSTAPARGFMPPPPSAPNMAAPSSTAAGPSRPAPFMGGLPSSSHRMQGPGV